MTESSDVRAALAGADVECAAGDRPEQAVPGVLDHLVVRVRTEGAVGVTAHDVKLATALDAVFSSRATGAEADPR